MSEGDRSWQGLAAFHLTPRPGTLRDLVAALWRARGLGVVLARKDFFVRYRRAVLGVGWALVLPVMQTVVLVLVFSNVKAFTSHGPYVTYVLSGIGPVTYAMSTIGAASTSIVDGAALSSRIWFPRALLPLIQVASGLVPLGVTTTVTLLVSIVIGPGLGPPIFLLLSALAALVTLVSATVLVTSAIHVYLRDVRYLVQAATTLAVYVTPVVYPLALLPHWLRIVVECNPLTGIIVLFRRAVGSGTDVPLLPVGATLAWTVVLLLVAAQLHRRFDRLFADRL